MIVQESDILLAALDRRLQVDPLLAIDPLTAIARSTTPPGPRPSTPTPTTNGPATSAATLTARLPLGEVISARIVEVPQPDHVIAEIGALRVALAWPKGNGITPQPGSDIGLRVLAHKPMLLFQSVPGEGERSGDEGHEPQTRWSSDALRLQQPGASPERGTGPVRFDVPILEIDIVPLPGRGESNAPNDLRLDASLPSRAVVDTGPHTQIDLDDVIVARSTALVDGVDSPLIPRATEDGSRIPTAFVPLVLQGPAWPAQPMELVVRRERKDDQFDNPALDHWCGEVVIDLPHLGRIAGHLALSMQGLRIRLEGNDEDAVDAMTSGAAELANALAVANLRVSTLSVGTQSADHRRPVLQPMLQPLATTFWQLRGG